MSVIVLDPIYIGVSSLLLVVALVLGGRLYCAVVGKLWNFFSIWRGEFARLGVLSYCYDWGMCMKSWEVGVYFKLSLLESYCGGGHGWVIDVFVWRGDLFLCR